MELQPFFYWVIIKSLICGRKTLYLVLNGQQMTSCWPWMAWSLLPLCGYVFHQICTCLVGHKCSVQHHKPHSTHMHTRTHACTHNTPTHPPTPPPPTHTSIQCYSNNYVFCSDYPKVTNCNSATVSNWCNAFIHSTPSFRLSQREYRIGYVLSVAMSNISHTAVDCNSTTFQLRRSLSGTKPSWLKMKCCTISIYCAMWSARHHHWHLKP